MHKKKLLIASAIALSLISPVVANAAINDGTMKEIQQNSFAHELRKEPVGTLEEQNGIANMPDVEEQYEEENSMVSIIGQEGESANINASSNIDENRFMLDEWGRRYHKTEDGYGAAVDVDLQLSTETINNLIKEGKCPPESRNSYASVLNCLRDAGVPDFSIQHWDESDALLKATMIKYPELAKAYISNAEIEEIQDWETKSK